MITSKAQLETGKVYEVLTSEPSLHLLNDVDELFTGEDVETCTWNGEKMIASDGVDFTDCIKYGCQEL